MNRLRIVFKYIKYLITAQSKYAIQSPFLYELATKVIYKKKIDSVCQSINNLREELSQSEKVIEITDFGAGSSINNSKKRKIKDIARNSAKNSKFGELIYRLIKFYKPKNIIELGTSLGVSTSYLARANNDSKVFTFEGCPETSKIAKKNFDKQKINNTCITIGDFDLTLAKSLKEIKHIDLAFIDGNHQEKATINYFEECLIYSNNNTIFIFDDIHWSVGMERAWEYIKNHKKTTLTVNLFFIGIVFVKSELSKQNFTIRF